MVNLVKEPRDRTYTELLRAGLRVCEAAMLVIREASWLDERGAQVLQDLRPYLTASAQRSEWPGTSLRGDTALVNEYALHDESMSILAGAVIGLYQWVAPLPEDLCLLKADATPWLVSIAHEDDGYLCVTSNELRDLVSLHPALGELFDPRQI
jgi:hypothetical protein